jgi:hypothetical protein
MGGDDHRPLLLVADRVRTADPTAPGARAVLTDGARIAWVGDAPDDAPHDRRRHPRRLVFDGAELHPAFVDAHAHLTATGLAIAGLDLRDARSVEDCLAAVRAIAGVTPGHVIWGSGWDEFDWRDVQDARLTGDLGMKNPVDYTDLERRTVATHEAGHATVAYLAGTRRLEILSIVKRAGALGLLAHGDLDEVYTRSRTEMYALVDIAMGGMCAEEVFFDEAGTGPGGDLAYATRVACEIVGTVGMAGSLVSLAAVENSALNDTNLVGRVLADPVARPAVDDLLARSKAKVRALVDANRHLVEALREALLERDELVGDEIIAVLEGAGPPVRDGLQIERRAQDRRHHDWLRDTPAPG